MTTEQIGEALTAAFSFPAHYVVDAFRGWIINDIETLRGVRVVYMGSRATISEQGRHDAEDVSVVPVALLVPEVKKMLLRFRRESWGLGS